ncbi:hypothetical protein CDAR_456571 [Caerostris darwini]|uniref:Uncharacterized protein n=1 Tax=Caerostris darwini TaxID=1538125 RepID=A0AAV4TB33_9ARAC|nr:hypothetical protein CDAR_456571 [Caerostris darwini]
MMIQRIRLNDDDSEIRLNDDDSEIRLNDDDSDIRLNDDDSEIRGVNLTFDSLDRCRVCFAFKPEGVYRAARARDKMVGLLVLCKDCKRSGGNLVSRKSNQKMDASLVKNVKIIFNTRIKSRDDVLFKKEKQHPSVLLKGFNERTLPEESLFGIRSSSRFSVRG